MPLKSKEELDNMSRGEVIDHLLEVSEDRSEVTIIREAARIKAVELLKDI